jgi:hypothetical protein
MPFQSEKQRRYLWANEPEIARDWTDTYGSGIAKALGGRMNYIYGGITHPDGRRGFPGGAGRADYSPMGGSGPDRSHDRGGQQHQATAATQAPVRSRIQSERQQDFQQRQMKDLIARQQAEKEYTRQGVRKVGPQLSLAGSGRGGGGIKNFLGNWGSTVGGSQLGGGLGSMLFGPWGMLLGSIFGGGVGRRGWKASQTPKRETWKDIAFGENTLLSNLFNKRINEQGRGITATDASKSFASNQLGDDSVSPSAISLADMSREDFEKLANERGIEGLDLIQSRYQGQEYLDDLNQIGEGAGYIRPTREELDAGINLGDLTGDVWTGGKGLEKMTPSEYENYIGNRRR